MLSRVRVQHAVQVVVWGPDESGKSMHDRFLLTNQCGVMAGESFECKNESTKRKTTWTLLDKETWGERREDLIRDVGPYEWIAERSIK